VSWLYEPGIIILHRAFNKAEYEGRRNRLTGKVELKLRLSGWTDIKKLGKKRKKEKPLRVLREVNLYADI
jgi:hypothetical protein